MGFGDTSVLCKIVFILLILCFVIDLIGFAIPYWYLTELFDIKLYGGLWNVCAEDSTFKSCVKMGDNLSDSILRWFRAVQAFSILSWVCFLAALVFVIVFMFIPKKKILYLVAIVFSLAGASCALIAFAVYAGKSDVVMNKYSAAFALTIIAFILGLIIGFIGIFDYLGVGRVENQIPHFQKS